MAIGGTGIAESWAVSLPDPSAVLGAECDRPLALRPCGVRRAWGCPALEYSKVWGMVPSSLGFPRRPEGSWKRGAGSGCLQRRLEEAREQWYKWGHL